MKQNTKCIFFAVCKDMKEIYLLNINRCTGSVAHSLSNDFAKFSDDTHSVLICEHAYTEI